MPEPNRFTDSWIDSYMRYVENTEPPLIFKKWCAVSVIAAALQRKCFLDWGHNIMYPNLYVVLTAPAGRARKGTAMKSARPFLDHLDLPLSAEAVTRESLIRIMKDSEAIIPMEDGPAITHSSLTVFSAELTVFLGYNNLKLMADLTDWFDCADDWTYQTKNQGTDHIKGVFLNLLGATTPELIRSTLPNDAIGGGFTSRLIFVYAAKKEKAIPFPFLDESTKVLQEKLKADIEAIHRLQGAFRTSPEFLDIWKEWYTANGEKSPFGMSHTRQLDSYVERRPTQLLKLSLIMSADRSSKCVIEAQDFRRALALLEETEVDMPNALGGIGTNPNADMTFRMIQMINEKPRPLSELIQHFIYDADADSIIATAEGLVKAGLTEKTMGDGLIMVYKKVQ